jgi:phosphohistidine phosphatase SixA
MELNLILLRHGEALMDPDDFARPLSDNGQQQITALQGKKSRLPKPHRILVSDAKRARSTASILVAGDPMLSCIDFIPTLYLAEVSDLKACLSNAALKNPHQDPSSTFWVIGHNPGLSDLACELSKAHLSLGTGCAVWLQLRGEILQPLDHSSVWSIGLESPSRWRVALTLNSLMN